MTESPSATVPLKQAAQRSADELSGLHERLERLEHGLEAVFAHSRDGLEGQTIAMIQELDMLRQSIGALADFIGTLARNTDDKGQTELALALNGVPLRDMAMRLAGSRHQEPETGQPELF